MPVLITETLSSLFVERMFAAPLAILLELDAVRIILLVLLGRVVTAFALRTRQGNHRAHEYSLLTFRTNLNHAHERQREGA